MICSCAFSARLHITGDHGNGAGSGLNLVRRGEMSAYASEGNRPSEAESSRLQCMAGLFSGFAVASWRSGHHERTWSVTPTARRAKPCIGLRWILSVLPGKVTLFVAFLLLGRVLAAAFTSLLG